MQAVTYKVNEGSLLTYLLFGTFLVSQFNFVYIANLNINFIVTLLLFGIFFIKQTIFRNKAFLLAVSTILFFTLVKINYYSIYFSTFYLTILFGYFIGYYSPAINLPDFFKKLFFINIILNLIYYLAVTHSPFILEGGKLRLVSISGGPPSTSFIYLSFFLLFYNYKKKILAFTALALIILTGNRITILTALSVIALYYALNLSLKKILLIIGSVIVLLIVAFTTNLARAFLEKARFLDKNGQLNLATFEGRLVHWKWAIIQFKEASLWHKLFGYGINATKEMFFNTHVFMGEYTGSGAMHNEFLRILVENGIVGLLIVLGLFYRLFRQAFRSRNRFMLLSLTSAIFLTAVTDNILYSYYNYLFMVFFLLAYHSKHIISNHAKV